MAHGQPRDSQKSKVYDAEDMVDMLDAGRLETIGEIEAWVDKIVGSRWWKGRCGVEEVLVKDGRGRRSASAAMTSGRRGELRMPRWSRSKMIILHELAHVLTDWQGKRQVPGHGRMFARFYLALVKRWIGYEAWQALRQAFKASGVKYVRRGNRDAGHLAAYQFSSADGGHKK